MNTDYFLSSIPIFRVSIIFSCFVAQAEIFNTLSNRCDESGQPRLVPSLMGKTFSLAPLSAVLAVGSVYTYLLSG